MPDTLRLFAPLGRLETLFPVLRRVLSDGLRLDKPLPVLDLAQVRCFDLAVLGSSWRVRAPYVYPLLCQAQDLSFPERNGQPLEGFPGVDWLVLGGDMEHFARTLRAAVAKVGWREIRLVPYLRIKGPLPRERREGDVPVRLRKTWHFVNHVAVAKIMDQLLALPEERWTETGYVAVHDHIGVFAPYIERFLAKPPRLVLELGCGLGQMTRSLARMFPQAKVVGLDVSLDSLAVARQKFDMPNLEFKPFDFANRFAFDTGAVDLIVSSSALNISDNQAKTAAETFRVLAPDGLLVNGCICEPFHVYWDFPRSAFRPTRSNLLLHDWNQAAAKRGHGLALYHWTQAQSSHYFVSAKLASFAPLYQKVQDEVLQGSFVPYDYPQCTAVMAAGGKVGHEPARVPGADHLEAVEEILGAYGRASSAVRELSEMNWLAHAALLGLWPESLDFLTACLPRAGQTLATALSPELLESLNPKAA
jgi:ubiquinone/menaquinone biosynthesis C-methylase UbiE